MWSSCRKNELDPVGRASLHGGDCDGDAAVPPPPPSGHTRASDSSSPNHGWYMLVVFRMPLTPVTKTAQDFCSGDRSVRDALSTAPSQLPSLTTRSRSCRAEEDRGKSADVSDWDWDLVSDFDSDSTDRASQSLSLFPDVTAQSLWERWATSPRSVLRPSKSMGEDDDVAVAVASAVSTIGARFWSPLQISSISSSVMGVPLEARSAIFLMRSSMLSDDSSVEDADDSSEMVDDMLLIVGLRSRVEADNAMVVVIVIVIVVFVFGFGFAVDDRNSAQIVNANEFRNNILLAPDQSDTGNTKIYHQFD
mmetsp:Transcript_1336/g.3407  ORF Transcript_1336/g.3407 Transcript_1336/m.3407 type:complete len:307 (-) Transcript_1336:28-948(-)